MKSLPYSDILLSKIRANDPKTVAAWGRHIHWGYWADPADADGTAEDFGAATEALVRLMFDIAGVKDGMRVLDVGCGVGGTIASLNDCYSDLNLVGVNLDPDQLEQARSTVIPKSGNSISFVQCNANELDLDEDPFDVVFAVECIFHFDRPAFFRGANQLLGPDGRIVISDYTVPGPIRPLYRLGTKLFFEKSTRETWGPLDVSWSKKTYSDCAENAGMKLSGFHDITKNCQPTYGFLREMMKEWSQEYEDAKVFDLPTKALGISSGLGIQQYVVARFDVDSIRTDAQPRTSSPTRRKRQSSTTVDA